MHIDIYLTFILIDSRQAFVKFKVMYFRKMHGSMISDTESQ